MPLGFGLIVALVLRRVPNTFTECSDYKLFVPMAVSVDTFLLGAVAALVGYFKSGIVKTAEWEGLEKRVAEDMAPLIISTIGETKPEILSDFVARSKGELDQIRERNYGFERTFEWGNYTVFLLTVWSIVLLFCAGIMESSACWCWGEAALIAAMTVLLTQIAMSQVPRVIKEVMQHSLRNCHKGYMRYISRATALNEEIRDFREQCRTTLSK